ncbi:MAG: PaaI family thioesterase [Rhizorhabdus sp.]|nr:PaaI family thioesterase [Rhizorhabdus sp.]
MRPLPPYAVMLGIRVIETADGSLLISLPPSEQLEGRPGFLHGGVISGVLEIACYQALFRELGDDELPKIKPIDVSVDFLRGGAMIETFAVARIVRIGQRVANATAEAWQSDRDKLIATARMHLLLDRHV